MRFWLSGIEETADLVNRSKASAVVSDNILSGDRNYGLDVNAGWSAADLPPLSIDLDLTVSGNQMSGARAPALVTFLSIQTLGDSEYFPLQPIVSSTYRILDLDGELGGVGPGARYDWAIPACNPNVYGPRYLFESTNVTYPADCPAGAPRLNDIATINGVPIPLGARLSGDQ
jgi:hypothetical protein